MTACTIPLPAPAGVDEGSLVANPIRFAGWGNTEELTLYETMAAAHMKEDLSIEIENLGLPYSDYAQELFVWIASGGTAGKPPYWHAVLPNAMG